MSKRLSVAILAVLITCLLAGPALAWDETKHKARVQELLDQVAQSFAKKDLPAVAATSAPGATIKYPDGRTMTMAQWSEAMARDFTDWQDISVKFVVKKAWPKAKDRMGAFYSESHQFTRISDPGHMYGVAAIFRVTLTNTPQGWRFLEFNALNVQFTRDGKPFKPQAQPKQPAKAIKSQG